MNLKQTVKDNKLIVVASLAYLGTFFYDSSIFQQAVGKMGTYLQQMLEVLPAVMVVSGLISVWVPKKVILDNFGSESGLKGKLISVFVGSISAGPIYAAFPITQSLLLKGASITNIVVIISAWAVVKLPMLIVEVKFLGLPFAATRYLLTVPAIIGMSVIVEKIVSREGVLTAVDVNREQKEIADEIEKLLPELNCGSCDYGSCRAYAEAVAEGKADTNQCAAGDKDISQEIELILKAY